MRVIMDWGKTKYPKGGQKDGIVYCYLSCGKACVGRKYYHVPLMKQNSNIISIEKITLEIWKTLPIRIKHDLKIYSQKFKKKYDKIRRKFLNSYGIFLKIIHKIEKQFRISQKIEFSMESFFQFFSIYSVYDYIKAGYLLPVPDAFKLNNKIISLSQPLYDKQPRNLIPDSFFDLRLKDYLNDA